MKYLSATPSNKRFTSCRNRCPESLLPVLGIRLGHTNSRASMHEHTNKQCTNNQQDTSRFAMVTDYLANRIRQAAAQRA
jgi:hypothetical protein